MPRDNERSSEEIFEDLLGTIDDPARTDKEKLEALAALRAGRRKAKSAHSRADLFYRTLGRPAPTPLTPTELAELEREMDEVDAALASRYGQGGQARRRDVA